MKKVQMQAREIVDPDIEEISLVKRAANRQAFKILKSEDLPEGTTMGNLGNRLSEMFGTHKNPEVTAVFVRADMWETYKPVVEKHFDVSSVEEKDGVMHVKQEGFSEENIGSLVGINGDLGVGLNTVVKEFSPYPGSSSFKDNVATSAFFPSLHNAMESLGETVWNQLNESTGTEDAETKIDKSLKDFRAHVNGLVRNLPNTVFKMEFDSLHIKKVEDERMDKPTLTEAHAGDLDGLLDEPVVEKTEEEEIVKADDDSTVTDESSTTDDPEVTKTEEKKDPLELIAGGLTAVIEELKGLKKTVTKQNERIEEVAGLAKTAQSTAETTVVAVDKYAELDSSLASLVQTDITKTDTPEPEAKLWDGLLVNLRSEYL